MPSLLPPATNCKVAQEPQILTQRTIRRSTTTRIPKTKANLSLSAGRNEMYANARPFLSSGTMRSPRDPKPTTKLSRRAGIESKPS